MNDSGAAQFKIESGGFNIHRIDADKAKKLLRKKNPALNKLPKKIIPLH